MKLKVLGSGSAGNCYLLQNNNETLIIECGLPYKTIMKGLNFNLNTVVGCLITHAHQDHCKSIKDILQEGIEVYTSQGTISSLDIESPFLNTVRPLEQFKVGGYVVLPFETEHDCEGSMGFLIQHEEIGKLLFITDSFYCKYKFNNLSHIMIECNYSMPILSQNMERGNIPNSLKNRLLKSHFSLEHVKEFLKANDLSQVKDITLIHLSDGNSNAREFKTEIERLTGIQTYIAEKGLEVEL